MSHTNPLPELPRPFVPGDEFNPRNYYTADQMREYAAAAYDLGARSTAAQPAAWDGAEEWEQLAWQLCAEENGEDACTELVWEGGAIPEPWGDRWMKYEGEAKRMISLVRQFAPPAASGDSTPASEPAGLTDDRIKRHTLRAADCPPDSKVLLVSSVRRFLAAQGDPSGALRPEPEAVDRERGVR